MSSNGGGGSNLLDMGLMIAAGVAAPELAATMAPEIMAAGGAGAVATGAAVGAGTSALTAAATGQNVGRAALFGGIGGGISGGMGPNGFTGEPPTSGGPLPGPNLDEEGNLLPNLPSTGAPPVAPPGTPPVPPPAPTPNFLGDPNVTNKALYTAAGINALGYMNNTRPAGAYTPPNAIYTGGPLQKFRYDPNNYQPDVVTPPAPLYHAQYAQGGITALAKGGKIKKYGFGGFLDSLVETPVFHAQQAAETYENHPEQAIAGINTPAEARVWNGATGSQYQPTTNMYGGPTQADYAKGQQQGVNMTAGHVADSVVPIVAGAVGSAFGGPAGGAAASYGAKMANQMGNNYEDNLLRQQYYQNPQAFNQQYGYVQGVNYAAGGMASGGISTLGSYSDGGRLLKGPGDGMSDSIPAMIGKKQEARLADGEFVVPADVVSGLGNGSTDAGAKHLYKMMDKVRHARTGRKSQGKQIKSEKYLPA